jgi:SAM-dependent methyltransferase
MFSAGDSYERFMGRWSRALAFPFVQFGGLRDSDSVLDVGSGTGAVTAAVAALSPSSRIVGIDPAAGFVAYAQAHHAGDLVQFEVGDAQRLRFADRSFTRTLSLLNMNFIPDPVKALQEMCRVTQPGGTVAAAVWDYPQGMEMLRVFWDQAVALNREADAKDERHMRFSASGELAALFRQQPFAHIASEALAVETRFSSFDDYWLPFLEQQGPAGAYVASLSASDAERLRLRLRHRLLGDGPDAPIALRARAWAVRGTVPGPSR